MGVIVFNGRILFPLYEYELRYLGMHILSEVYLVELNLSLNRVRS